GGLDGVASADELVQPKGEGGEARFRVPLATVAREEVLLDGLDAALDRHPGAFAQLPCRTLIPRDALGHRADESARAGLRGEPERAFDPAREGVGNEPRVVARRLAGPILDACPEGGEELRVGEVPFWCGAPQRLTDDVFG